ncbi:MAG TPA: phospholipase D family protein [Candidatus Binataceae bacterium]|nr:phospholipase D family protein [Candidatus Binataceae bacterium]
MTDRPAAITLLRSPWTETFIRLVSAAEDRLLIGCPFIKSNAVRRMLGQLERLGRLEKVRIALITDLRPESVLGGGMDLGALSEIGHRTPAFELTHLPSIHAKVYVADYRMAIVTSGNLTEPGLQGNVEYGVALEDEETVREVRSDFESYSSLGAKVSIDDVEALSEEMEDLKVLYQRAEKSVRNRARRAFEEKLKSAHLRLLRHRAKGKTTHAIFSDTIRFLLAKGPLKTEELHPLVRILHPDLCDDSLDRIIDGVHFGKKWKHYVRNAQQYLKRHGEIRFDRSRWHLVSGK